MKRGDLVRFRGHVRWLGSVKGSVGLVLDVRINPLGSMPDDTEIDFLIDGRVVKDILGPLGPDLVEVINEAG